MQAKKRLAELDSLRGIAAILVVVFHLTLGQKDFHGFFSFGLAGVELFFLISGYVIFLTIENKPDYKNFLISRFARLFPAYWICVTLTASVILIWALLVKLPVIFPTSKEYLINLTMLQEYFNVKDIDGVYWTLRVELLFYLFIVVVFLTKKLNQIEIIGFASVFATLIFNVLIFLHVSNILSPISDYFPLINFFPFFIAGIVFYKSKFEGFNKRRILILIFCLITGILVFKNDGRSKFLSQFDYAIVVSIFFLTYVLYYLDALYFIVNKVTLFLGKISYSLYLIHNVLGTLLVTILVNSKYFHFDSFVAVAIAIVIVLIVATLINKFIEMPGTRFLKEKLSNNQVYVTIDKDFNEENYKA